MKMVSSGFVPYWSPTYTSHVIFDTATQKFRPKPGIPRNSPFIGEITFRREASAIKFSNGNVNCFFFPSSPNHSKTQPQHPPSIPPTPESHPHQNTQYQQQQQQRKPANRIPLFFHSSPPKTLTSTPSCSLRDEKPTYLFLPRHNRHSPIANLKTSPRRNQARLPARRGARRSGPDAELRGALLDLRSFDITLGSHSRSGTHGVGAEGAAAAA
jgi:hypothetical protein